MIRSLPALIAFALLAAPALAESNTYDKAFALAEQSGKPVLFVYTMETDCPLCNGATAFMLDNRIVRKKVHPSFVVAEIPISAGGQRYQQYRQKFSGNTVPFWVVATPEGEFLAGGDYNTIGASGELGWSKAVTGVAKKYPALSRKDRAAAAQMLAEAKAHVQDEEFGEAYTTLMKLNRLWFPRQMVEDCRKLMADLGETGEKRLAEADKLWHDDKKFVEAALAFDRISVQFGNQTRPGVEAAKRLGKLLSEHKDIRPDFESKRRAARAEALLARARKYDTEKTRTRARTIYNMIARDYLETPGADEARKAIARIDAELAKAAGRDGAAPADKPAASARPDVDGDEKRAAALVALAESYHASRLHEKARAKLTECVEKYPKTPSAKQAKKLLEEWSEGS